MIKIKKSSYFQYWDVNNLYGWAMSQKLPALNVEWIKGTSKFNENVVKIYNAESRGNYFLEVDAQCPEELHELHNDFPFLPEGMEIEIVEKLAANLCNKTKISYT